MIHPLHTFCFAELYTPDVARAKKFYGDLFGWTTDDRSGMYSIFQKDGQDVVALRRSDAGESLWVNHVAVESVDRTAARVRQLGGRVIMPPFDTPGVARTAVVASPEGAIFGLWEAQIERDWGVALSGGSRLQSTTTPPSFVAPRSSEASSGSTAKFPKPAGWRCSSTLPTRRSP